MLPGVFSVFFRPLWRKLSVEFSSARYIALWLQVCIKYSPGHCFESLHRHLRSSMIPFFGKKSESLRLADIEPSGRIYTLDQIKTHDQPHDLWMIIFNKVYDVTDFCKDHPGGAEVMFDCGGVDATEAFEDVAHSDVAVQMLGPYYLGELHPSECVHYMKSRNPSTTAKEVKILKTETKRRIRKEVRKKKTKRKMVDRLSLLLLIGSATLALMVFIALQKAKWSYNIH